MSASAASASPPASAAPEAAPSTTDHHGQSNAQLAALLAKALADLEQAARDRDQATERAQRAESLRALPALSPAASGASPASPPDDAAANTNTITALQTQCDAQQRTIADLSYRIRAITDHWSAYDRWQGAVDARANDARLAVGRAVIALTSLESDVHLASSPLPLRDVQPFHIPSLSRKPSRTTITSLLPHPGLHIPPGAPGGRPISQAGVPANLPPVPIPSGVVAGRVRAREASISRRRSDDEPDMAAPDDPRPHRLSQDDTDSIADPLSESERHRKRLRVDAGPTSGAGAPPRRDRARFSDSPRSSNTQFSPQFTFPHNQPQYPPQHPSAAGPIPSPHAPPSPYPYSSDQMRHRGSDTHPGQLQIGERPYVPLGGARHPRNNSDTTLQSAITPTSAATTMSVRSIGSHAGGGSKDSLMSTASYMHHHHRYSRSSGDARADSLGDGGSTMIGGLRVDSPPPMSQPQQRRYVDRPPYSQSAPPDEDEDAGMKRKERQLAQRMTRDSSAKEGESMDVDDTNSPRDRAMASPTAQRRRSGGDGETEDQDSVDELLLSTAIGPGGEGELDADGEERDELGDDREMSPMSVQQQQHRVRRMSTAAMEHERWKERDRQLGREGRHASGDDMHVGGEPPSAGQQLHFAHSNGLVKVKEDQFRHYYSTPIPQQVYGGGGGHPSSPQQHTKPPHMAPPTPHHHSTHPMTTTFSLNHGQLQQTGRRGTIAGLVTSGPPRDESAYSQQRASYSGQGHARRHSNEGGPPSSNLSHPSLIAPASGGAPLSAGSTSTSILFPHAQPRHTGPGPAVKPTLNAQGQRTCRQCGEPGRYKEGKCVEKWGPGPAGPGTVCDRCRKKMKRIERRGTQDAATLGQHIPLVPLAASQQQQQQQQVSPRQYYSSSHGPQPYTRDGQQYSPSEQHPPTPQREYHFQTPLSANSSTWARASKDWGGDGGRQGRAGSIVTSPTSAGAMSKQQLQQQQQQHREREALAKPPKEKRRAPSYSESPSPPPPSHPEDDDPASGSAKSASQPRSNGSDPSSSHRAGSGGSGGPERKGSTEMERAAEDLMVELIAHGDDGETAENDSPAGTTVKEKDVEDDADADGDMEDALGEEEDAPAAGAGTAESNQDHHPPSSRKAASARPPAKSPAALRERENQQNLKPSWVKLEEDGVLVV